jgi:hypothetical protein
MLLALVSCSRLESTDEPYLYTELVMPVGTTVSAVNPNGKILIMATSIEFRRYRWRDRDATRGLSPRPSRRYGMLGIYTASATLSGPGRLEDASLEESQMHFPDERTAVDFLRASQGPPRRFVWSRSGLAVGYGEVAERNQLDVAVRQICIRGRKPARLSGAAGNVSITGPTAAVAHPSVRLVWLIRASRCASGRLLRRGLQRV